MDLGYILSCTKRGTQELQARSGHIMYRQWAILLLVSGECHVTDILAQLSSTGPDIKNRAKDLTRLMTDGYVASRAPVKTVPQLSRPVSAAPCHVRQALITDWRLSQTGASLALQRYLAEGPDAPIDFFSGLAAPLYATLTMCCSEVPVRAAVVFLEAHLDEDTPGNATETSQV